MPGGPRPIKRHILPNQTNYGGEISSQIFGKRGLYGALTDLAHSVDPRSVHGAIGLAGMMLPGKGGAEDALAAHLGHSEFRPYELGTSDEAFTRYRFEKRNPETRSKREERAKIYGRTQLDDEIESLHRGALSKPSDPISYGGFNAHKQGADMGYPNFGKRMKDIHGYSLPELMGLIPSKRIGDRNLRNKIPGGGFLFDPYRTTRGMKN